MIRIEIQHLDDEGNTRSFEFKVFNDWDSLIGYIWQKYTVDNMFPTLEEDIRLKATHDVTKQKCLLIIEQVM